jgi:deoxyribodipyrimidine photolyase-related protein
MDRNKDEFVKNHRMSQQVFGLKRLKDLPETRKRAQEILELLSAGKV